MCTWLKLGDLRAPLGDILRQSKEIRCKRNGHEMGCLVYSNVLQRTSCILLKYILKR